MPYVLRDTIAIPANLESDQWFATPYHTPAIATYYLFPSVAVPETWALIGYAQIGQQIDGSDVVLRSEAFTATPMTGFVLQAEALYADNVNFNFYPTRVWVHANPWMPAMNIDIYVNSSVAALPAF